MHATRTFRGAAALLAAAAAGLAGCADPPTATARPTASAPSGAGVAASLAAAVGALPPAEPVEVIVNFDGAATTSTALGAAVQQLGGGIRPFQHLSILAARLPAAQVGAVAALPG
jgi:hypothetical protein